MGRRGDVLSELGAAIERRIAEVRRAIEKACVWAGRDPGGVELLAVSKKHGLDRILAAHSVGQRVFGENRVQELTAKHEELGDRMPDLRWDLIGSLQTNKVKDLVGLGSRLRYVHSLDRAKLADTIQQVFDERSPAGPPVEALLQIHATGEESKHGVPPSEALALARHVLADCPRIALRGLMAMGPLDGDPAPVFADVARLRDRIVDAIGSALPVLSLGMTADLEPAIAAGSTMVRVGTGVFGARPTA